MWPPEYFQIVEANLRVILLMALGVASLGVYTGVHLVANGYVLGSGLATLRGVSPGLIPLVLLYIPLEFGAFVLTAAAALLAVVDVVSGLAVRRRFRMTTIVGLVGWAIVLILLGAAVEIRVMHAVVELSRPGTQILRQLR